MFEVDCDGESRDEFILSVEIESVVNKSLSGARIGRDTPVTADAKE